MSYLRNKVILSTPSALTRIVGLLLVLITLGCQTEKQSSFSYYDIDSLLHKQVEILLSQGAVLEKVAFLKVEQSNEKFRPDSSGWAKEFQVFSSLNVINKPIYRDVYKTESSVRNNESVKKFTATRKEIPVQAMTLIYDPTSSVLKGIEAEYHESNAMYDAIRYLSLQFEEVNGKMLLSTYSVTGGQKMFLADSVNYAVKAKISYPK